MASLFLPEGAHLFPEDLQRKVQEIDPNFYFRKCGGSGCRLASCTSWCLMRSMENGQAKVIAHSKTNHAPESILLTLRERYTPNAPDVVNEIDKYNAQVEKAYCDRSDAAAAEAAERLHDAMKRY